MQAVILAAGNSSRFVPFNKAFAHKSLIKLMGKTIIEHTLLSLKQSGITDVVLVVNDKEEFIKELGTGEEIGLHITYSVLEEARGMGAALLQAEPYLQESFFLLNPQHVDSHLFLNKMLSEQKKSEVVLLGKKDNRFDLYAFMALENGLVKGVVEKPDREIEGRLRLIGIYLLNKSFVDLLKSIPEDHYNFEAALDAYAKSHPVHVVETEQPTLTLKYSWDVLRIKDFLLESLSSYTSPNAIVAKTARLTGTVYIEDGAQIMDGVTIKGPAYIGRNAFVGNNSVIRNGVMLEENSVAGSYLELKNTIVMGNTTTHTGVIEDSVIGRNCKIAAGVITANVRLDRETIKSKIKEEKIDTGLIAFGMIVGDNTRFGVGVVAMPGVIIGNNITIGPSTTVMENVADNMLVYTKFETVTKQKNNE